MRPSSPVDTKSEKSATTVMTSVSAATGANTLTAKLSHRGAQRKHKAPEAFMSIQLEKVYSDIN